MNLKAAPGVWDGLAIEEVGVLCSHGRCRGVLPVCRGVSPTVGKFNPRSSKREQRASSGRSVCGWNGRTKDGLLFSGQKKRSENRDRFEWLRVFSALTFLH